MTKKRGSKKGQKWPKTGVQKRVKKGSKINFLDLLKKVWADAFMTRTRNKKKQFKDDRTHERTRCDRKKKNHKND
jgi:hypothetical protein